MVNLTSLRQVAKRSDAHRILVNAVPFSAKKHTVSTLFMHDRHQKNITVLNKLRHAYPQTQNQVL